MVAMSKPHFTFYLSAFQSTCLFSAKETKFGPFLFDLILVSFISYEMANDISDEIYLLTSVVNSYNPHCFSVPYLT